MVGVAHLARAPGCGPGGGGFDPLRSPHRKNPRFTSGFFYGVSEGDTHIPPRLAVARRWIDRSESASTATLALHWVQSPKTGGERRGDNTPREQSEQWIDRSHTERVDSNACVALGSIPENMGGERRGYSYPSTLAVTRRWIDRSHTERVDSNACMGFVTIHLIT